jgi:hypothetical protein
MNLPKPPREYSPADQEDVRAALERAEKGNRKTGRDVELGPTEKLVMRSPDGTRWAIGVADDGTVSATAL